MQSLRLSQKKRDHCINSLTSNHNIYMYAGKLILQFRLVGGGGGGGMGTINRLTDGRTSDLHITPPGGRAEWERDERICNSHFPSRESALTGGGGKTWSFDFIKKRRSNNNYYYHIKHNKYTF